jgi:hypothetical protein
MITFFTTPKPFRGHIGVIQRNAIESWKRIHPSAEVILFGDEVSVTPASPSQGTSVIRCQYSQTKHSAPRV